MQGTINIKLNKQRSYVCSVPLKLPGKYSVQWVSCKVTSSVRFRKREPGIFQWTVTSAWKSFPFLEKNKHNSRHRICQEPVLQEARENYFLIFSFVLLPEVELISKNSVINIRRYTECVTALTTLLLSNW